MHRAGLVAVPKPTLPPALAAKHTLGKLCPKHPYQDSAYSLRRGSHCTECEKARKRKRPEPVAAPAAREAPALAPHPGLPPLATTRPELPSHWDGRGFLSPVLCDHPGHTWRDTAYCLRFRESEECVRCVTARTARNGAASVAD